jgi:pSer/pThr/pTyr-binding forkhead associated (FHA) protein
VTIAQRYRLIVKKGPNAGQTYPIFAERITIGRDPMSDIIFKDPEVSRQHVRFKHVGDSYEVEDLGSTNGTFVDGKRRAGESTLLTLGQEIALGGAITLIFDEETNLSVLEHTGAHTYEDDEEEEEPHLATADYEDPFASFLFAHDGAQSADEADIEADDERNPIASISSSSSRPPAASPSHISHQAKNSTHPLSGDKMYTRQQVKNIIASTVLITLLCCASFLLFMYFVGGDWLLNPLQNVP